ncbi:hypothetical protein C0V97_12400 [Asaia sp. W19]|uniref:hypothetical protein n=1 Tax=unclassified Asaia TaxID=2685023 RepID=UPI000F8E5BF5|nr:hypothetical protein [Asaia sp. W19]RUT25376.1 hypothetical protein C0V97_12400 [Asaia sp. W19]
MALHDRIEDFWNSLATNDSDKLALQLSDGRKITASKRNERVLISDIGVMITRDDRPRGKGITALVTYEFIPLGSIVSFEAVCMEAGR